MTNVVKQQVISFKGGSILAVILDDGRPYFSLKRACETLGIAYQPQFKRFQDDDLLSKSAISVHMKDSSGRVNSRPMVMVHSDALPFWLSLINPNKVKESVRPALEAFRNEAYIALNAWFNGGAEEARAAVPEKKRNPVTRSQQQQKELKAGVRLLKDMANTGKRLYKALDRRVSELDLVTFRDASYLAGCKESEIIAFLEKGKYLAREKDTNRLYRTCKGAKSGYIQQVSERSHPGLTQLGLLRVRQKFGKELNVYEKVTKLFNQTA